MSRPPLKILIAAGLVALAGSSWFFVFRRVPACSGDGKYMATAQQCRAYGIDARICAEAVEKARAFVLRVAPKSETSLACELAYAECFETPQGGFAPSPSFCLRSPGSSDPAEVRYLEYVSDRMNRRKTREVRVD
ncbi:MAG: hypothetical protein C3F11_02380 [Methylocystaceae bacterium]|nr:MAG: hypothetical protein C3F11_02380 [Methylocystaceae bacterium]